MVAEEIDEIIDQLYLSIHKFLVNKVGNDLGQDIIDINIETTENNEIKIEIDLYLELSPFSIYDVQTIAEDAIKRGIDAADRVLPEFVIKIQHKKSQ